MAGKKPGKKPSSREAKQPLAFSKTGNQRQLRVMALVLALFAFLLYANTLGHGYVLDDFSVIKENFVTKQGLEGIPTLWKTHARYGYWPGPGELYRPIPMTMFAIEWAIAPDQPWLPHLVNVLLYALTGGLLFLFLTRLFKGSNPLLAFLTTLFFIAHPVHTEVVANIKSRDEIMAFLCSILALRLLWKHLDSGRLQWLVLSLLSYTAALFSKENAVTLVAIVPLAMWFFSKNSLPKTAGVTALFAGAALVFVLVRGAVIGDVVNPGDVSVLDNFLAGAASPAARMAGAFLLLGKYLWVLLFPHPLSSDFGFNQIPLPGWGDWRVWLSVVAWVGLGVFALLRLKKKDLWSFAVLFFLVNFSIFANVLLLIGTSFGERLLYSASPGFALAMGLFLMKIFKEDLKAPSSAGLFQNKKLWAGALAILALYGMKITARNVDWKSSYDLYEADIEVAPNSAKLNFHYGLEIIQKGLKAAAPEEKQAYFARGRAHFEKAIGIFPAYHDAYSQLGLTYYREGNKEKALENYNLAIQHKPNFPLVYSNMGIIFFEKGDFEKAKECYVKAVGFDPRMVDALRNLGAVHAMQQNFGEAIKWFSQALQYAPEDPTINFYLGSAFKDSGQEEKGRPFLEKAYRLDPSLKK